jgi:hypothetical protein
MDHIIARLKLEHAELRNVIELVRGHGIGTQAGRDALQAARKLFTDHIRYEDETFYPEFHRLSHGDPAYGAIADGFAREMKELGAKVLAFFDRYGNGGEGMEFAMEFGRMHAALNSRWHKEETFLYAKYQELARRETGR